MFLRNKILLIITFLLFGVILLLHCFNEKTSKKEIEQAKSNEIFSNSVNNFDKIKKKNDLIITNKMTFHFSVKDDFVFLYSKPDIESKVIEVLLKDFIVEIKDKTDIPYPEVEDSNWVKVRSATGTGYTSNSFLEASNEYAISNEKVLSSLRRIKSRELFIKAENLYKAGKIKEAIDTYVLSFTVDPGNKKAIEKWKMINP